MNLFIFSYDIKNTKKTGNTYRPQLFKFFIDHNISYLKGRVGSTVVFKSKRDFNYWYKEITEKMSHDIWIELAQIKPNEKSGFKHNYFISKSYRKNFDEEWKEAKEKRKAKKKK